MRAVAPEPAFKAPAPPHRLQIVVDDHLTIRTPIEVMSGAPPTPKAILAAPSPPEPVAPMRSSEGLVRVDAPTPTASVATPPAKSPAKSKAAPAQPKQMIAQA
ncbi:MAG TPA: hypothetical protein VFW13_04225, partial [Phenylobacterium sp.]|nr:hypothetical protein [Phenylobacterium sp.]